MKQPNFSMSLVKQLIAYASYYLQQLCHEANLSHVQVVKILFTLIISRSLQCFSRV
jgi:hypothetical protein